MPFELQFHSGEGAIQYVPEAVARANVDILHDATKRSFLELYTEKGREAAKRYLGLAFEAQYGESVTSVSCSTAWIAMASTPVARSSAATSTATWLRST